MSAETVRTYGGWRERKGFGVAGLDGRRTAALMAGSEFAGLARPAGVLVGALLAWRRAPFVVVVIAAAAVAALLRLAGVP